MLEGGLAADRWRIWLYRKELRSEIALAPVLSAALRIDRMLNLGPRRGFIHGPDCLQFSCARSNYQFRKTIATGHTEAIRRRNCLYALHYTGAS